MTPPTYAPTVLTTRDFRGLLPRDPRVYAGTRGAFIGWIVYLSVATLRSLVHILAPDGGAGFIAGADLSVEGGDNIVSMFAQWGLEQLIIAMLGWMAVAVFRGLVPLMAAFSVLDLAGRVLIGAVKPFEVESVAPGAIGSYVVLPPMLLLLWFSLPSVSRRERRVPAGRAVDGRQQEDSSRNPQDSD
jgi:hypothetical protein